MMRKNRVRKDPKAGTDVGDDKTAAVARDSSVGSRAHAPSAVRTEAEVAAGGVKFPMSVMFGGASMSVEDFLSLREGDAVVLERRAGAPVDLLVGGRRVAEAEVVLADGRLFLDIVKMLDGDRG